MISGSAPTLNGPATRAPWLAAMAAASLAIGIVGSILFAAGRFAAGGGALLLSVLLWRWPLSIWSRSGAADVSPRWQRVGLLAVCAVAIFFRFHRLEPPGLWGDDAINGLLALDVLDGKIRSPFKLIGHAFSTFHAFSNFVIAGSFALLGPSLYALRLPGVIANLLCVPLLYGIASPLFGPRAALLSALFFASSPFQLGHAKGLLQNELGLFFEMFGLCLLIHGATRARHRAVVAAGIPIAFSLYTYHSAKLVPLIAAVALFQVTRLAAARRRSLTRCAIGGLVTFSIGALPAVVTYLYQPTALTGRVGDTGLWSVIQEQGNWRPLWDSLWRTLAVFHYQQGPIYHWFGIGTDPGLDAVVAALVLHGLVQSLRHWREPRHFILLSWLLIGIVPGILSSEAPRGYRVLIATPPLYVWAALPLARLLALGERRGAKALRTLAAATLVAVPLVDFNYYFYRVYTSGLFRLFQADHMVEMARALRARGPGWIGYIVADTFGADYESFQFLRRIWQLDLRDVHSLADVIPVRNEGSGGVLFLLSRGTLEAVALLRERYPQGALEVHHDPRVRSWWLDRWWPLAEAPPAPPVTFATFAIPQEMAASSRGSPATVHGLIGEYYGTGNPVRRLEPFPFYFFFPPTLPGVYSARVHGYLDVPEPGGFRLRPESDQTLMVQVDGRSWDREQQLDAGRHEIDISSSKVSGALRLRLYWQPAGGERQLIPPEAYSPKESSSVDTATQRSLDLRRWPLLLTHTNDRLVTELST